MITVREANLMHPKQAGAVVRLIDAYAMDPMGRSAALSADVKQVLADRLARHPTTVIFLAYEDDDPVGVAVCFRGFSTFAAKPILNVHDLAVLPDRRRRGIGKRLLEAAIESARELGCAKVTLEVREDNAAAQALYRSVGIGPNDGPLLVWTKPLDH